MSMNERNNYGLNDVLVKALNNSIDNFGKKYESSLKTSMKTNIK